MHNSCCLMVTCPLLRAWNADGCFEASLVAAYGDRARRFLMSIQQVCRV